MEITFEITSTCSMEWRESRLPFACCASSKASSASRIAPSPIAWKRMLKPSLSASATHFLIVSGGKHVSPRVSGWSAYDCSQLLFLIPFNVLVTPKPFNATSMPSTLPIPSIRTSNHLTPNTSLHVMPRMFMSCSVMRNPPVLDALHADKAPGSKQSHLSSRRHHLSVSAHHCLYRYLLINAFKCVYLKISSM